MRLFAIPLCLALFVACGVEGDAVTDDSGDTSVETDTDTDTDADSDVDTDADADTDADSDADTDADPLEAARATCVAKINALRASNGKPALTRRTSSEACLDTQATTDQSGGGAHSAFGDCGESGQNECLGHGTTGVESCLQNMWDERLQAGCSGCDACSGSYNPDCPDCDFYGRNTGDVCGHYVNMNADYFTQVACGFSEQGGWVVIDFW
ncbi:MAG: hypothetical protein EP330_15640 [Deltaproteobacteria bacterium]|nr:MAG: hypothetical protein EP330_15640 [Deltaproteobacteria bacterium]